MKIIRSRGAALMCAGAICLIALAIGLPTSAQQNNAKQAKQASTTRYVSAPGYITGTVTGEKGPEAGVWVIAETSDLRNGHDQDRRHRRTGPLHAARTAGCELQGVGPRLWNRGFAPRSMRSRRPIKWL